MFWMSAPFLLQMAGAPGSGKSALGRLIATRTGAVLLDKDVLKTAALDAGAGDPLAGQVSYESFFALAAHLLGQDISVVLDSPSFYDTIPAKGAAIAGAHGAVLLHRVLLPDRDELGRHLRERTRLRSTQGRRRSTRLPRRSPAGRVSHRQHSPSSALELAEYLGLPRGVEPLAATFRSPPAMHPGARPGRLKLASTTRVRLDQGDHES
jgi:hypothetical protein